MSITSDMASTEKFYAMFTVDSVLYFVESMWSERDLTLTITDGKTIWAGSSTRLSSRLCSPHVDIADMQYMLHVVRQEGVDDTTYMERTKKYLTDQDLTGKGCKYEFDIVEPDGKCELHFRWHIMCGGSNTQLADLSVVSFHARCPLPLHTHRQVEGSLILAREPASHFMALLERMRSQNEESRQRVAQLTRLTSELERQRADALANVEAAVSAKNATHAALLYRVRCGCDG